MNYFVLNFRSVPIQPWDLFSIRTAASVADNYEYTLDKQAVLVILGFLILLALEFFLPLFPEKRDLEVPCTHRGCHLRYAGCLRRHVPFR